MYKISSRYLQKWLRYNIKHVKNRHFSRHFGTLPWFSGILFFDRFWRFKKCFRVIFSRSLRKSDLKNMYRSFKSRIFFVWPFSLGGPEMTLTCIMVTKHRKWFLQMSVTLSMPIHWLCLRLTSKFYSPMSPSPKSRKFWLWPGLWRHQWPPGQIFDLVRGSSRTGLSNGVWNLEIGPVVWEISGGGPLGPPQQDVLTNQTPAGRGLMPILQVPQYPRFILSPLHSPINPHLTGVSAERHWSGGGRGA